MRRDTWRLAIIVTLLLIAASCVIWRLFDLNVIQRSFLLRQSQARILRHISIPAYRGMITDRLGLPLAISSPMETVWVNPKDFYATPTQMHALADTLQLPYADVYQKTRKDTGHEFVYLRRRNPPSVAAAVKNLHIPGVYLEKEYQRFYPEGEVTAHVVGLTNIDDQGQEGLELAYNQWLSGKDGEREVLKDRMGHIIDNLSVLKKPQQGHNLALSIDHRVQYIAYSALKSAIEEYHAKAGSVVVLDDKTGEVLAEVNAPSYNPNGDHLSRDGRYRNRAETDMYEPGSVIKPFNVALALESGKYTPDAIIDTSPGYMHVGGYKIKDDGLNYGRISLTQVLQRSSNIGAAKILMSLPAQNYWNILHQFGFGAVTHSGFPGESPGRIVPRDRWYPSVIATLAYGYGVAVTTIQLAHAYATLADNGISEPVSLLKLDSVPQGTRIISQKTANEVVQMLETVVLRGGTGFKASIPNYQVAGKTGTAYLAGPHGYDKHRYISSFVGMAPASHPRIVVAVLIKEPQGQHFGGLVSAPVFAKVMAATLRILDIPPDHVSTG